MYIPLEKLEVYQLSRKLSSIGWRIYQKLDWNDKKIMGNQFIESTDSTGANIAEGYGRFHFLDRAKFYFNARASLFESRHWIELLDERKKIEEKDKKEFLDCYQNLRPALNKMISSVVKKKIS